MKIAEKKIGDIKPYEKNPRKNDNAVDKVANSIKEFGFNSPIIVDKDGIIVAGHTRYKAAMKLGLKEVPCVTVENLTDEQVKAYRLADNKTAELADWDFALLHDELDILKDALEFDMQDFGFYEEEPISFDEIFEPQPKATAAKQEQPKQVSDEKEETVSQQIEPEEPISSSNEYSGHETEETVSDQTTNKEKFTVTITLNSLDEAQGLAETLRKDGYACEVDAE